MTQHRDGEAGAGVLATLKGRQADEVPARGAAKPLARWCCATCPARADRLSHYRSNLFLILTIGLLRFTPTVGGDPSSRSPQGVQLSAFAMGASSVVAEKAIVHRSRRPLWHPVGMGQMLAALWFR